MCPCPRGATLGRMTPAQRMYARAHLEELARRHRIKLRRTRRWKSEAHAWTRQAWIPRSMRSPVDYLIGLHEIGHIVLRHGYKEELRVEMCQEATAWAWAVEHADPELLRLFTKAHWTVIGSAMASFLYAEAQSRTRAKR